MKKHNYSVLSFFFAGIWNITVATAQVPAPVDQPTLDSDGNITVAGSSLTLSTPDLSEDNFTYADSLKLYPASIMELNADLSGGVKGTINQPNGYITLEMYGVDGDLNKSLLYKTSLTNSSDTYSGTAETGSFTFDNGRILQIRSDDIKKLMQFGGQPYSMDKVSYKGWLYPYSIGVGAVIGGALAVANKVLVPRGTRKHGASLFKMGLRTLAGAVAGGVVGEVVSAIYYGPGESPDYTQLPDSTPMSPIQQPVIVKITINDAIFKGAKVPGIGEIKPSDFFLKMNIKVNGASVYSSSALPQNALDGYADTDSVDVNLRDTGLTMGDTITFEIETPFFAVPDISGIPDVWIARFAGDLMYYCTPSVIPKDYKAFLGYDTRVHNLMLRRYPAGFEKQYDNFDQDRNVYKWSWVLKRRMDADTSSYTNVYEWPKTQTLAPTNPITLLDGTQSFTQRRNQKEGLNMQYLTYWPDWGTSDFQKYAGTKYMLGFDDDELALLGTKCPNPYVSGGPASCQSVNTNILKLERLPWKELPEGDQVYSPTTGYPESGFVLNEMVTAYKKHHNPFINTRKYAGYEIQDLGTSAGHPDGNGTGNNAAPGKINIQVLKKSITVSLNVQAPLSDDKGFYGTISGTQWPSFGEKGVPYTISGLQNLDTAVLDGFSMEYEYEDKLGILVQDTRYLKNESVEAKRNIASTGTWRPLFDIHIPSYASVTAYYQRTGDSQRVMVAGKELKAIFLLFTGVQTKKGRPDLSDNLDLLEGRGTGSKIWLEDFRDSSYGDFTISRRFGNSVRYTKKYTKEYVFNIGDRATFVTFDGDPHTFASNDSEWYLGSRYIAKRVTDEYLDGSISNPQADPSAVDAYLQYYIKNLTTSGADPRGILQTTGRSGKEFTKTWDEEGDFEMEVNYRNSSPLYYKIKVVNYGYDTAARSRVLARVVHRDPTEREKRFLGLTSSLNKKVAEVVDISSHYAYVEGPRATVPKENRWAKQRDFDSKFAWFTVDDTNVESPYGTVDTQVQAFINDYDYGSWFWGNWAHHYSSNWLRPPASDGGQGLPSGLLPGNVHRIYDEKTGLNPYNDYMSTAFFTPTPPANWQHTIPLVSITQNQGPRLRTNPSSAYDLYAVFNPETGAFSGNPTLPPGAESIQAPNISDDDKDKLELYYKLRNKQMVFFDDLQQTPSDFRAYNINLSVPDGKTYIARCH